MAARPPRTAGLHCRVRSSADCRLSGEDACALASIAQPSAANARALRKQVEKDDTRSDVTGAERCRRGRGGTQGRRHAVGVRTRAPSRRQTWPGCENVRSVAVRAAEVGAPPTGRAEQVPLAVAVSYAPQAVLRARSLQQRAAQPQTPRLRANCVWGAWAPGEGVHETRSRDHPRHTAPPTVQRPARGGRARSQARSGRSRDASARSRGPWRSGQARPVRIPRPATAHLSSRRRVPYREGTPGGCPAREAETTPFVGNHRRRRPCRIDRVTRPAPSAPGIAGCLERGRYSKLGS